ncbi:tryptophan synthase subunit alpha, partial [Staphylococcus aureus]|uniref:tryptophan synthase subunit alpha n=1 Tax=Staphylococcus aureus TaxID=1280 RepID=UPI00237B64FA
LGEAGVSGFILADLTPDEGDDLEVEAARFGIGIVYLVAPTTPVERRAFVASRSQGFLYGFGAAGTARRQQQDKEPTLAPSISLALASEERLLKEGQRLPNPREPQDSFYVLLDGSLAVEDTAGEGFGLLTLFGVLPGARTVEARGPCRLVRLEPTRLFELAGEHLALI